MKRQAPSLKIWIGVIMIFIVVQYLSSLFFEEKIFYPNSLESLSDGHFYRLERDFQNTTSDELKVAVIGSSRVAKGIECPDEVRDILMDKGMAPIQLNKIWESFDPFEKFVTHKKFLKKLLLLKPDLICIQAEMLAIQMSISAENEKMKIEGKFKNRWNLEYKGDQKKYISKKVKYQSKVNQELVHTVFIGNPYFQGEGPCSIQDVYSKIDTLNERSSERIVKKLDDIRYTFEDLERLRSAGVKVVIIETPFPLEREKIVNTPKFKKNLKGIQKVFKNKFDIDYWEYTGSPLYYKHYADRGHLNSEGRKIYTEWLLEQIHKEIPAH